MAAHWIRGHKRGFTFIGLLLVLAIILFLSYKSINLYFKKPIVDRGTEKALFEQGIEVKSYKSILDSTRETSESIQNIQSERMQQLEEIEKKLR